MPDDATPIRQQYLEIKRQYPDTILFFRLGDFYETFDQDAEITSRELDLVLTSRPVAKGRRVPMAGIPYHAVENYLARLIDKGFHVAICEQVGDQPVRGLFSREVTRIVTPGTVTEPGLLRSDRNNYLASLFIQDKRAGISFVDITTGEFAATEHAGEDILSVVRAELTRLHPAEVLLMEGVQVEGNTFHFTRWPSWRFETARCQNALQQHFKVASLDGFGLRGLPGASRAAGVIVQYVTETQPAALKLLSSLSTYSLNDFMVLDSSTRRNLEITETIRQGDTAGSLLNILDRTVSPMGKRLIRQWVSKPLLKIDEIYIRQHGVGYFLENGLLRADLIATMRQVADVERLINRISSGTAQPHDLVGLRSSLRILPKIITIISKENFPLQSLVDCLHSHSDELQILESAIQDDPPATLASTGIIQAGFSAELDGVMDASKHAREWIANLESIEKERTGIKTLKVGFNKVFGYYIEVSRGSAGNVPAEYIRKQTLVNNERFITPEMKEYESLVLNAEERIHEIELRLFKQVCASLAEHSQHFLETAHSLANLDVLAALAESAARYHYTRPEVVDEPVLDIRDGRHPVVEQTLRGERFVPNDATLEDGEIIRLITGPNMSGKSTFLRQVALIVLLAQMGSFVPAASAKIGLVDRIFTRIGAQDEIYAGQSTFMVEMTEAANILNHATRRSLLVLDEIGRGTSTYDGLSIAWSMVEFIHNHPRLHSRTLFATHYHELTQLSELLPGVRNYNVAVSESEGRVVFLHKIVPGGTDRSYGIHVAQLAGMPSPVIQRASEILQQLEASSGKAVSINPNLPQQLILFPETNPLLEDLKKIDINALSPIEALNRLYEWKRRYLDNQ